MGRQQYGALLLDGPTLLDLLGGQSAVDRIVERLLARLLHDPLLSGALEAVDLRLLKRLQSRFFADAFGAVPAHEPLAPVAVRVSGEQLTRVVVHVHDTLVSLGLPEAFTEQLVLAVLAHGLTGDDPPRLIAPAA